MAEAARMLGRGAVRLAHTAAEKERKEREDAREYYDRERRRALLTPRGLRRATFGTSLLALGLLPCSSFLSHSHKHTLFSQPPLLFFSVFHTHNETQQTAC